MKNIAYLLLPAVCICTVFITACNNQAPANSGGAPAKLQGKWKGKTGENSLKITDKHFIMDNDEQNPEDYFVKADTIFTSFEGNQPYTKFVIQKLDDNNLNLLFPDSVTVEFIR